MTGTIEAKLKKIEDAIFRLKVQIYELDSRTQDVVHRSPFSRIIAPEQSDASDPRCNGCGELLIKLGLCGECWIKRVEKIRTERERPITYKDIDFPFGKPVR